MVRKYGLYAVWVIAVLGAFGSLYLNEIQHWDPCRLCWYQQICIMPIAIIAGMAAWRGYLGIAKYLIPQALIGLGLALYQFIIQFYNPFPACKPIEFCKPGCLEKVALGISFATLTILSMIGFLAMTALLIAIQRVSKKDE